jgi:hypothetical protein
MQKLTFADLQEIRDDEAKLKELTTFVHTAYANLCALCRLDYSTMNQSDDDDDDEDEEEMSASRELVALGDLLELKDLSKSRELAIKTYREDEDGDDDEEIRIMREAIEAAMGKRTKREADDDDAIEFEGEKITKGQSSAFSLRDLFRMIRQASHPDKIMRFSAVTKEKILECFHDAEMHYKDDNYPGLMLCYLEIFLLRNDPRPINYYVWKYVKLRHRQILAEMQFIMDKPYMPAIKLYKVGRMDAAKRVFKAYWESLQKDPMDDMDCFDE